MSNGKISFQADPEKKYTYKTSIVNGKMDKFDSSDAADAYKINLSLVNGVLRND